MLDKNVIENKLDVSDWIAVLLYFAYRCFKLYLSWWLFVAFVAIAVIADFSILYASFTFTDSTVAHVSSIIIAIGLAAFIFRLCYILIKKLNEDDILTAASK